MTTFGYPYNRDRLTGLTTAVRRRYIIKGHGFNVEQDFARATEDMPIEIDGERSGCFYGYIAGNPNHPLRFMRRDRVRVRVRKDCTVEY